jgi:hypothetical protein
MAEISSSTYSETDASNNTASPDGWPEGMAMAGINNSGRQMMGALKRFWARINGAYASTGSADAYVLTPTVALGAYVTGERYSFRANFSNTGTATLNISSLGAKTIKKMTASGSAALAANDIRSGQPVTVEYDGTDLIMVTPVANTLTGVASLDINGATEDTAPDFNADYVLTYDASATANKKVLLREIGKIAQVVNTQTGAVATGTTTVPADDSIPQNTEGDEYMTLAITPTNSSSTLVIEVTLVAASSAATSTLLTAALFQDSTANALAAAGQTTGGAGTVQNIKFAHKMTAGTTSATTFKVRAGASAAGTTTFNGSAGSRVYGGVMASSITITEILP